MNKHFGLVAACALAIAAPAVYAQSSFGGSDAGPTTGTRAAIGGVDRTRPGIGTPGIGTPGSLGIGSRSTLGIGTTSRLGTSSLGSRSLTGLGMSSGQRLGIGTSPGIGLGTSSLGRSSLGSSLGRSSLGSSLGRPSLGSSLGRSSLGTSSLGRSSLGTSSLGRSSLGTTSIGIGLGTSGGTRTTPGLSGVSPSSSSTLGGASSSFDSRFCGPEDFTCGR